MTGEELPEQIRNLGPSQVRTMMMTGGIAPAFQIAANKWLAQKDEEERIRNEASQASQVKISLSTKTASWVAAIAALAAAIAAVVTLVVELKK